MALDLDPVALADTVSEMVWANLDQVGSGRDQGKAGADVVQAA